jgi:hypothetical protein
LLGLISQIQYLPFGAATTLAARCMIEVHADGNPTEANRDAAWLGAMKQEF